MINMRKEKRKYNVVLGIDIGGSTRMGLSLFDNPTNTLLDYSTIRSIDSKNNLEHRLKLVEQIKFYYNKYNFDVLLYESIRLFSKGHIQLQTILSLNKVQTTIVNEFSDKFDIFQVDVRSWKSKVLGNGNADKLAAIKYVHKLYPQINLIDEINHPRKKEIELQLNADLADSICISKSLSHNDYSILQDKNKQNYK